MEKKKFTDRLQLLNGGRDHYLEFLRNLTPQILLLSGAVLLGARLDFTRFDFDNIIPTLVFFVVLGSFILAFWANASRFYERCSGEWKAWLSELQDSLTAQDIKGSHRIVAKLKAIWRERFVEFLELLIVQWFFPITLAIVIGMAFNSAVSIWRANYAG